MTEQTTHAFTESTSSSSPSITAAESSANSLPTVEVTGATVEQLTCGINETINECGRACEDNCSNVC